MKFTLVALSTLLALAVADTTTTTEPSTITSTPQTECAKRCDAKDICCTAKCFNVPCPSDDQADDTNSCVSACPQGTGSPADIEKYSDCQQSCYSSHYWGGNGPAATHATITSTGTSGATATQTSSSSSSTKTTDSKDGDSTDSTDSEFADGTQTSSSFSQQTSNAAANVQIGASAAGILGLVAAAFAL